MGFDPGSAANGLLGGLMIGAAAALLLLGTGRIAGISGILGGLVPPRPGIDAPGSVAFLAGLVGAPALWALTVGAPAIDIAAGTPVLVLAGLLVGFGTRLGNGCTSGHGVCGMSRLSVRSLAATAVFMTVAALTVATVRHWSGA